MKESNPHNLPWYISYWFIAILGAIFVVAIFLLIELILPVYTLEFANGWSDWVKTVEFRSFVIFRVMIGALVFGILLFPNIKKKYIEKQSQRN